MSKSTNMNDMNDNIEIYRRRSSIQPHVKHLPKTLMDALQDSDKPMSEDDRELMSLSMMQHKNKKQTTVQHDRPPEQVQRSAKAPTRGQWVKDGRVLSQYNPLKGCGQDDTQPNPPCALKPKGSNTLTVALFIIVIVLVLAIVALGISFKFCSRT